MLNPEKEDGNIEYKRQISNCKNRIESLASQMNWRLVEGKGKCYYYLGVEDNGHISKQNRFSLLKSLKNLKKITSIINSKITNIEINDYKTYEYIIVEIQKKFSNNYLFLF